MSRLGAHVVGGSRNGYGLVIAARPSVILAVNEGGALEEAKQASGGHTITVFRDTSVYPDAPPGIDQMTVEQARQAAEAYFPALAAVWALNPADAYTTLNEPAGNDPARMAVYAAYELRMMELAEAAGKKLCVCNLAGGTPGDIELWKLHWVPVVLRAWAGGHLYGRHAYGGGDLAPVDGNSGRPFVELDYLNGLGHHGGLLISEAGLDGGYGFPGVERWLSQVAAYDALCRQYPDIVGFCAWTYGEWAGANLQPASADFVAYLAQNPTPKWEWPVEEARRYSRHVHLVPQDASEVEMAHVVAAARPGRQTITYSADDAFIDHPNLTGRTVEVWAVERIANGGRPGLEAWVREHYPPLPALVYRQFDGGPPPAGFQAVAWPVASRKINQWFAANPEAYQGFGLPGHDGVDHRAGHGEAVWAIAPGTVYMVGTNPAANYGIHVRLDHGGGHKTIYAHLLQASVGLGAQVAAGQLIGLADNTGNSSGDHLHFGYKRDGAEYVDPAGEAWPSNLFDPWLALGPLYEGELAAQGVAGYVWAASTVTHPHRSDGRFAYGFGVANLNLRQEPSTGAPILGVVAEGTPFRLTGPETASGYWPVVAPLPVQGNALFGLHASADGAYSQAEVELLATARADVVKVLSSSDPLLVGSLAVVRPAAAFIVRAFLDFGGRNVTPQEFYEWTIGDVQRTVAAIGAGREVWIEIHNEPNLVAEGLGASWADGAGFTGWWLEALTRYRQALPAFPMLFPGLSPGGDVPGIRQGHESFAEQARAAIEVADGLGVHCYWSSEPGTPYPMPTALAVADWFAGRFPGLPLWLTEASNNRPASAEEKGQQYVGFWQALRSRPAVAGVTYFVASASNPAWGWGPGGSCETWLERPAIAERAGERGA